MKYKKTIITLCLIIFLVALFISRVSKQYDQINDIEPVKEVNKHALPLIEENSKYIELQTKHWIKKREQKEECYAVLEKDKVIMAKWMEHFNIPSPKLYYYDYHDNFTLEKLKNVIMSNKDKRMVIKISHLQSNFGIIIVPPYNEKRNEKYIEEIYQDCQKRFRGCFVCNHDRSDPPTNKQIQKGQKESYYKLYQTIKPGLVIEEFYDSGKGVSEPKEFKVLVLGNKILAINKNRNPLILYDILMNSQKYQKVFDLARKVSDCLGSTLVRVDMFVREGEKIYEPSLNEISLSPNSGMGQTWLISKARIEKYKNEIKQAKHGDYPEVDKMIRECPFREMEIEKYYTDADNTYYEKFSF